MEDVPVDITEVHELPRWPFKTLQVRFLLDTPVDVAKWKKSSWRLFIADIPLFDQTDNPSVVHRSWHAKPWTSTDGLSIYLHSHVVIHGKICSRDFSFCMSIPLLLGKLDSLGNGDTKKDSIPTVAPAPIPPVRPSLEACPAESELCALWEGQDDETGRACCIL